MGGGFAVDNPTLIRFFSLHFILPFLIAGASIVHLLFLHQTGRRNPLGLNRNFDKISFHPYFSLKDLFGFFIILFIFRGICFFLPVNVRRPRKFFTCQPVSHPRTYSARIYFLIAYAILRSIPNKLGGVVALALSIAILLLCPFLYTSKFKGFSFYPLNKILF